jgi:uncharacterized protein
MTRTRFSLAIACCLAWLLAAMPVLVQQPMAIPPLVSPVIDLTGTLSAADIERLRRQALALQHDSGGQLQSLMRSITAPESIEDDARRAFDTWTPGEAEGPRAVGDASCGRSDISDRLPDASGLSG